MNVYRALYLSIMLSSDMNRQLLYMKGCTLYLVKNSLYVTTKHYMRLYITIHLFGTYINLIARNKAFVKYNVQCRMKTKFRITQQCMS